MPRFGPSGFFRLSRCLVLTPWLTSKYPVCCVCVCARIHTYTHISFHPCQKREKTLTTPLSLLLSKTTLYTKRQVLFIDKLILTILVPQRQLTNCAYTRAYSLQRVCSQMCMLMSNNTCMTCTPAYALAPRIPVSCTPHPLQTTADTPSHAHLCNCAATTLSWKLLLAMLSHVQTSCRLLVAARPPAVPAHSARRLLAQENNPNPR